MGQSARPVRAPDPSTTLRRYIRASPLDDHDIADELEESLNRVS